MGFAAWSFIIGPIGYVFGLYCIGDTFGIDGKQNDFYNSGMVLYFAVVITHALQLLLETRNFDPMLTIFHLSLPI